MTQETTLPPIAQRIVRRMKEVGLTHADGSPNVNALDMPYATAHNLLSGKTKEPDLATLQTIAKRLRTSVPWLTGEVDSFDVRAYEMGREHIANAVREAIDLALATSPPEDGLARRSRERAAQGRETEKKAKARRAGKKGGQRTG